MISRQRTKTFVEALYEAGLIKDGIASYKIPRVTTMGVQSDGELTLGAMNPANYDPATLVTLSNISPIGFWEVFLQDVKVGGKSIGFTSRNVILDTGTVNHFSIIVFKECRLHSLSPLDAFPSPERCM